MKQEKTRPIVRGELALAAMAFLNSLTVVLLLHSGFGISPMASLPYTIWRMFPFLSLGTWNYLYQTFLVMVLMLVRRRFVPTYLLSFVVGVVFGVAMDIHEMWISLLPTLFPLRVLYLVLGMLGLALGLSLGNRCKLPILPVDLFSRELSAVFRWPYRRVKTTCDLVSLTLTVVLSLGVLGNLNGVGLGTLLCALFIGTLVSKFNGFLDRKFCFVSFLEPEPEK